MSALIGYRKETTIWDEVREVELDTAEVEEKFNSKATPAAVVKPKVDQLYY